MRTLAIDPGTSESAYVVYEGGKVLECGIMDNGDMLEVLQHVPYSHLAVESIASYGMAVGAETFQTCIWIGRFIQASPVPHTQVYRKDVKMHLCGSPRAKDPNVRQALMDRFGGKGAVGTKKKPGPLYGVKSHLWSALAVAVTWNDLHERSLK